MRQTWGASRVVSTVSLDLQGTYITGETWLGWATSRLIGPQSVSAHTTTPEVNAQCMEPLPCSEICSDQNLTYGVKL